MRACSPAACLLSMLGAATVVAAQEPAPREIVQQRLPDGRVIFTDRPLPNAKIERSWQVTPDDPGAEARRAAAQRDAAAVTERIARQTEAERERQAERQIAADRAAAARAEREAAEARLRAAEQASADIGNRNILWWPWPRPPHLRPPARPQPQPVPPRKLEQPVPGPSTGGPRGPRQPVVPSEPSR
ncbi:hypothetical protein EV670_1821 [Rivibacter subsaxonicus]|uniref:DUF4124 domain-containing protein n=2 Tax=Rivibacter subsaxonicus TaxID=457575 RepID=A0A4V2FU91_9BURK|nr:hypothetical protein EV670_1821 [Rivibacter subsaxonicus]